MSMWSLLPLTVVLSGYVLHASQNVYSDIHFFPNHVQCHVLYRYYHTVFGTFSQDIQFFKGLNSVLGVHSFFP